MERANPLFVDGAPCHKGPPLQQDLAWHPEVHRECLPPYQPGLNPQERLWRQIRYECTSDHWFADLDATWKTILETSRRWSPELIRW